MKVPHTLLWDTPFRAGQGSTEELEWGGRMGTARGTDLAGSFPYTHSGPQPLSLLLSLPDPSDLGVNIPSKFPIHKPKVGNGAHPRVPEGSTKWGMWYCEHVESAQELCVTVTISITIITTPLLLL